MGRYVTAGLRTLLDLLKEFNSVEFGLEDLIELLPRLQPRYYSISSASNASPNSAHVGPSAYAIWIEKN